jgi:hypothetical protein
MTVPVERLPADDPLAQLRADLADVMEQDRKSADQLNRIVLVGSTGAILASVTFLKDIAPEPAAYALWLLVGSWVVLIVSGAACMLSLRSTRQTARLYENILRAKLAASNPVMNPDDYNPMRTANDRSRLLGLCSLVLFGVGIVLLTVFAAINLPWEGIDYEGHEHSDRAAGHQSPETPLPAQEGVRLEYS